MSKVILTIDKPEHCKECPLLSRHYECVLQDDAANVLSHSLYELKQKCPLDKMPKLKREEIGTAVDTMIKNMDEQRSVRN